MAVIIYRGGVAKLKKDKKRTIFSMFVLELRYSRK
jgi:hypothetical protein